MATNSFLDSLIPAAGFKKYAVTPETAKVVDDWYKTESMTLNFGEYAGRPDENIFAHTEQLAALIAEGWYVVAVRAVAGSGEWERVVKSTQATTQSSTSAQSESSSSSADSSSTSSTSSKSESSSNSSSNQGSVHSSASGRSTGSSSSEGASTSSAMEENNGSANETTSASSSVTDETTEGGAPYWTAYQEILLERKRMQSELVLQAMVDQFVERFNEGKKINQDRYDELVSLYTLMQSSSEKELNKVIDDTIDFKPLFEKIQTAFEGTSGTGGIIAEYRNAVKNLPANWLQSRIDDINLRFNNLVSSEKARVIGIGLYNTTVWTSLAAGIEHQRSHALDAVASEIATMKVDAYGKIASASSDLYKQLVEAEVRIMEALQKRYIEPINMRNTVFKWMLEFMERRTDETPSVTELPTIAEKLGYAGAISAPKGEDGAPKGTTVS